MSNVDPVPNVKLGEGGWSGLLVKLAKWAAFLNKVPPFPLNNTWQSFASPNLRPGSGAFTTASATVDYIDMNGIVLVAINVQASNVGTAAGNILIDMPFTNGSKWASGAGRDVLLGTAALLSLQNGAVTANIANQSGGTLWNNGMEVVLHFFYSRV